MKKMKPYVLPIIAGCALIYALVSMVRMQPKSKAEAPPIAPATKPYTDSIGASGMLEANSENISVGAEMNGTIAKVFVQVGQKLKKGDPIFKIDTRQLEADLRIKESQLKVANARVRSSEAQKQDSVSQWQSAEKLEDKRSMSAEESNRRKYAAESASAKLEEARADVAAAQAQIDAIRTDLERSIIKSPIDATVLKLNARLGEYASSQSKDLVIVGNIDPLFVRVDVDEEDASKVKAELKAAASPRGNATDTYELEFIRFEPYVIPKKSLTGDTTERVDTRVLQVIYKVKNQGPTLFVGQLMDVFIEKPKS